MATAHDKVLQIDGYYCTFFTDPAKDGKWWAWINFQRVGDFTEMRTEIPGMRHHIEATFESQEKALEAAVGFAHQTIAAGNVGL
jgi:hypothetical protein